MAPQSFLQLYDDYNFDGEGIVPSEPGTIRLPDNAKVQFTKTLPSSTLDTLVGKISSCSSILDHGLGLNGKIAGDDITSLAEASPNAEVRSARVNLIDSCRELLNLVIGPSETLKHMCLIDKHNLVTLQIINHYGIAEMFSADDWMSHTEIAERCRLPLDVTVRIIRQAMTYGVFCEPQTGQVAHTAASLVIPELSPLLSYQLEICLPSSLKLLESLREEQNSPTQRSRLPFQIAHDTAETWWSFADKSPHWVQAYGKYMSLITSGGAHDLAHVVNGYDWTTLGSARVIDVGGADGFVAQALANAYPNLQVTIQDSDKLKAQAESLIPASLSGRVKFLAHNFFDQQPVSSQGADVYLLRHILHDWPEAECLHILRNITRTMKKGARIIVAEQTLGPMGTLPAHTERIMRALDMQMMVQYGSKERTLEDFRSLFALADARLEMGSVKVPAGSADTFMELVLRDDNAQGMI